MDIGCGSGEVTQRIREKGYEVTGLDFSPIAVERAQERGLNCTVADLDSGIPLPDNMVQAVWAGDVIEHVFDPIFVLREVNRILVPGGHFLCTIPYDLSINIRIRILAGHSYQENTYKKFDQYKHHTFFSVPLMMQMFKDASLRIEQRRYVVRLPRTKREFICGSPALIWFTKTIAVRAVKPF